MRHLFSRALVMWIVFAVLTTATHAHNLNMASVRVRLEKSSVAVSVVAHLHAFASTDPTAEISRRLKLRLNGKEFRAARVQLVRDNANGLVMWQAQSTTAASRVEIAGPLFPERSTEPTILTVMKGRQVLGEVVVDAQHPVATIGEAPEYSAAATVAHRFMREGMKHIFLGLDHVLFLLSLMLLGGTSRQLLKIATAFTAAHTITLSLAATKTLVVSPRFVEPIIALSIVAVAAANLIMPARLPDDLNNAPRKVENDYRPWFAFGFGLIHGFGFASALSEIGLPPESLVWALGAFNIGVELGQAALIVLSVPWLAWLIKMRPRLRRPITIYGSATVALIGVLWFMQRILAA